MKKLKKFLLGNKKLVIAFVIGVLVTGGTVYAATLFSSSEVLYDNSQSSLVSTTVQGAIDELAIRANDMDTGPIDPDTFQTNSTNTIYASSKGVCIYRNSKLNCFKINNWDEEKNHIQEVFSDVSCDFSSSSVDCDGYDFYCNVLSDGFVSCNDDSDGSYCSVDSYGSVDCN